MKLLYVASLFKSDAFFGDLSKDIIFSFPLNLIVPKFRMFLKESFIKTNFSVLLSAKDCPNLFGFTSFASLEFSIPNVFIGVNVINGTCLIDQNRRKLRICY